MKRPIRIWFMRTALSKRGGAEAVVTRLMLSLPKEEFLPVAVWLYWKGEYGEMLCKAGISTYSGLARSRWDVRLPIRLLRLARQETPDLIMTTENALACFWAGVLKRLGQVPHLVLAFHTTRLVSRATYLAVRFTAPVCDRLVALTPSQQQFWQAVSRMPLERFAIIPNGIDIHAFVPTSDKVSLKRQLHLPEDKPVVGLVAYFKEVKNLPLFVEVAERLVQQGIDAHFVLVGDGPERPRIEQLITQKGLDSRFTLPGLCETPLIWYQAFDILLLTSYSEALPLTILEAAACEVPAVAADVGGVRDVIVEGVTGFIAPSGDVMRLADSVKQLIESPPLRLQMGHAARERVIRCFSSEVMAQQYIELFRQIVQETAAKQ
jgi:glycosyltransferase involved in cell wall biosynthesis